MVGQFRVAQGGGREFGDSTDWKITQSRQDGTQIDANRDFEPPAGPRRLDRCCKSIDSRSLKARVGTPKAFQRDFAFLGVIHHGKRITRGQLRGRWVSKSY